MPKRSMVEQRERGPGQELEKPEIVRRNVLIPADIYLRVSRIAREEGRSINQQMVAFLRDSAKRYEQQAAAG